MTTRRRYSVFARGVTRNGTGDSLTIDGIMWLGPLRVGDVCRSAFHDPDESLVTLEVSRIVRQGIEVDSVEGGAPDVEVTLRGDGADLVRAGDVLMGEDGPDR